jgi:hypothetical protein
MEHTDDRFVYIVRWNNKIKGWCGYVGYSDIKKKISEDLQLHGDVTYYGKLNFSDNKNITFVGFDTFHSGDINYDQDNELGFHMVKPEPEVNKVWTFDKVLQHLKDAVKYI